MRRLDVVMAEDESLELVTLPCACSALRRAGRAVSRLYDEALAPSGLRVGQYALLATLSRVGPGPVTRIADDLVMDRTTLSRNLAPLERAGLVRVTAGSDRRQRLVALTPLGQTRLIEARPLWLDAQQRLVETFGAARTTSLLDELAAVIGVTR